MPLDKVIIATVNNYLQRDLPEHAWWEEQFTFVRNRRLRMRLARELYSARYMGKLMEATDATGDVLLLYVRQQVIIYASIYEAIIDYLLFTKYKQTQEVVSLTKDLEFIEVRVQSSIIMTFKSDGKKEERLALCRVKQTKTTGSEHSIQ